MASLAANSVVHLELHTTDLEGAVSFFSGLLGWRPERIRAGACSYLALGMGERVGGGVVECGADMSLWLPYVEVRDVDRTIERAKDLGGEILLAPREGPQGWRSIVASPQGGEIALWQAKPTGARSKLNA